MTTRRTPHVPSDVSRGRKSAPLSPRTDNDAGTAPETVSRAAHGHDREACEICADLPHPKATHCTHCGASWGRGTNTAHCPTCCGSFSTPGVFDKHLKPVGQRGCNPPETVTKRKTGERVFANPTPNAFGTPIWHLAGDPARTWGGPDTQLALIEDGAS